MEGEAASSPVQPDVAPLWKHVRRFFIVSAIPAFLATPALFYWIGPVWGYAAETDLGEFLSTVAVVSSIVLVVLLWLPFEATFIASGWARVLVPLVAGILMGVLSSALLVWTLLRFENVRFTYARLRPQETVHSDLRRVRETLEKCKEAEGQYPESVPDVFACLEKQGIRLRFTRLEKSQWRDPWGRPIRYGLTRKGGLLSKRTAFLMYCLGPNGMDEDAAGDDIR